MCYCYTLLPSFWKSIARATYEVSQAIAIALILTNRFLSAHNSSKQQSSCETASFSSPWMANDTAQHPFRHLRDINNQYHDGGDIGFQEKVLNVPRVDEALLRVLNL
jgi:hypothetical protein